MDLGNSVVAQLLDMDSDEFIEYASRLPMIDWNNLTQENMTIPSVAWRVRHKCVTSDHPHDQSIAEIYFKQLKKLSFCSELIWKQRWDGVAFVNTNEAYDPDLDIY
jgi:hypothetical protein